jgi:putative acetyltransferase
MIYKIDIIHTAEYADVVGLWEASVRATHDFLKEEDILFFKPLIITNIF